MLGLASDEELAFQQVRLGTNAMQAGQAIAGEAVAFRDDLLSGDPERLGDRLIAAGLTGLEIAAGGGVVKQSTRAGRASSGIT